MAGAAAATGTEPDSAPHSPLKTSVFCPVRIIRFKAFSGVPMISTPRTSWSGRPSGKTFHTIKGMISNFCSPQTHATALEVETAGKAGDLQKAAQAVNTLDAQLEALIGGLTEFLETRV